MKVTKKIDLPAVTSSKVPTFTPDSDLFQKPISRKQLVRRKRYPGGGVRLKRPETPLLRWKFIDGKEEEKDVASCRKSCRNSRVGDVSVRKLAAGVWRLQPPEVWVAGGGELCNVAKNNGFVSQPTIGHLEIHSPARHNRKSLDSHIKEVPQSPNSVTGSRHKFQHKLEPTFHFSNYAMEDATKWDPCSCKAAEDVKQIYGKSKLQEEQVGVVSVLESELESARARIQDLETERRASKKKLEQLLEKLNEEHATWRSREHEKIRAVRDDIKTELNRERKSRQRTEMVNVKLVNELADAKLSAKQYFQDYEKERKARELTEEVCDELAKEIGEDRAEFEALKRESMKMREEVDDERKMLQMAEVWREERVQLKLIDAKVTLEEKYSHMHKLIKDLETFLSLKRLNLDTEEIKRAETLKQYANSVNIQEIQEFKYEPSDPDDIFSVLEEVNFVEKNVKEFQQFDNNCGIVEDDEDEDGYDDDESGWETVSNGDTCKVILTEGLNRRLSNETRFSSGTHLPPGGSSGESPSEWSFSPGSGSNPRIMKGCIEWPRVVKQRNSLKAKLIEARMESQKVQLRQVLKQKI